MRTRERLAQYGRVVETAPHNFEGAAALLRHIGAFSLASGLFITVVNLVLAAGSIRPGGPSLALSGTLVLLAISGGHVRLASHVLCWGLVGVAWVGSYFTLGLLSVSWLAAPVSVIIGAWLMGRRAAMAIAAGCLVAVLSVFTATKAGQHFHTSAPPEVLAIGIISAILLALLLGNAMAEAFFRQMRLFSETATRLGAIVDSTGDMIWSVDAEHFRLTSFNPGLAEFLRSTRGIETAAGMSFGELFGSTAMSAAWAGACRMAEERGQHSVEFVDDVGNRILEVNLYLLTAAGRNFGISVFAKDITEQKRAREQIEFLAYHDPLTELPNRLRAFEIVGAAIEGAGRGETQMAVCYVDLDNFKSVNDTHGHQTGDHLLKAVVARLKRYLGETETLCRLSGDEFLVIARNVAGEQALEDLCARLLAAVGDPFQLRDVRVFTSLSIGAAIYPQHGAGTTDLLRNADAALNESKRQGRSCYHLFDTAMKDRLSSHEQVTEALRQALEREEFEVYYQPQIDLSSGAVTGAEALLRWHRPDHGMVMPSAFIGIAEDSGLITPIGKWVLREACRQCAAWREAGWSGLSIAVNLSAIHFREGQAMRDVKAALEETGLDPRALELELTESVFLRKDAALDTTLGFLKAAGVRLAIDDFGTGYSNLTYVRQMSIDKLKIDRSFVANICQDEGNRAIVRAIVQIGQGLNVRTLAEGVEDVEVRDELQAMGCSEAQGFLYARPLPAAQFTEWLHHGRAPERRIA